MPKPAKAVAKPAKQTAARRFAEKLSKVRAPKSTEAKPHASAVEESALSTERRARFVQEYLIDLNATQAYLRAGYKVSEAVARRNASRMLTQADVQAAVEKGKAERAARTEITADRAIREAWAIMTADPRELMEYRVGACRHCWGEGHRYQFTPAEFEAAESSYAKAAEAAIQDGKPVPGEFDPRGGPGYDKARDPNPDCPECAGEGIGRSVFKDVRKASPAAASLFAGIKETKEGLELKVHSKDAAMDKVFRHLGLYNDKIQLTMPTVVVKDLTGRKD